MDPIGPSVYLPIASALVGTVVYLARELKQSHEKVESLLREVLTAIASLEIVETEEE